jgi:anaerobic ribonucleoside-triphosphate reductase activating protein
MELGLLDISKEYQGFPLKDKRKHLNDIMNNQLKYSNYEIVFQEIPNELTLAINVTGCPHKCPDCHSKFLWEYTGNYIKNDIVKIIEKYKSFITCVCFMGGDQNQEELIELCKLIKSYKLKTALYSGLDDIENISSNLKKELDFIKIGSYNKDMGGLNDPKTNQKMFEITNNKFNDITYKFQR